MVTNKKVKAKTEKAGVDINEISYSLPRDQRVLTAEGWKRMQLSHRQQSKVQSKEKK